MEVMLRCLRFCQWNQPVIGIYVLVQKQSIREMVEALKKFSMLKEEATKF